MLTMTPAMAPPRAQRAQIPQRAPTLPPPPPTQEQLDTAHYLLALLHDSDAQALMLWEQSQHALAPLLGPQLASLRAALAAYDFDEAAQLLQRGLSTPAQNG